MFDIEALKKEFVPLLIKKISLCNDFVDNWILANFSVVIKFLITLNTSEKLCGETIKEFINVVLRYEHRKQFQMEILMIRNWLSNHFIA